jgi:ribose 5-phosphate isomerase B
MRIALGCDHAGFSLKARIASEIEAAGHQVLNCGIDDQQSVDYPDVARRVVDILRAAQSSRHTACAVRSESDAAITDRADGTRSLPVALADRGIVVCGSGVGVAVAANKFPGIRAGVCHDTYSARQGVEHDDMNVLCLGARVVGPELAAELVRAFLSAQFSGEDRHLRRLAKIAQIERET